MATFFKFVLKLLSFGILFSVAMGVGLALYAFTLLPGLPTVEEIRKVPLNIPLRIYSADKKLIAEYGNERRIPVMLDQVPPLLVDAILVTEDDRFYHHTGVDFPGLMRAAISNVASQSRSQGASTITMQVARNFFLNPEKTYTRKLKEILLAFNMERALTKDEILELYLNKIFLGHRSYGFAAAAQFYYGNELSNLSLPEIAMLAGLPKAPSRDNPLSNPTRAKERRAYVLKRLHELDRIDTFSYEQARNAPITASRYVADADLSAPYASEMARQILYDHYGESVYQIGLDVYLTIHSDYQAEANAALRNGLIAYDRRHGFKGPAGTITVQDIEDEAHVRTILSALDTYPASRQIIPAAVVAVEDSSFTALNGQRDLVTVELEDMSWARKYIAPNRLGPEIEAAGDVVSPGDIVYVRAETVEDQEKWSLSQIPEVSGALVSLDSNSGAILAITGGFDYFLSKFNRATQAQRQIGSNIKPFIYSAALEHGFTPASLVSAAPIVVTDDLEGIWRPQNYSKKFFGPTRLRKALSLSLNLVSVRLLRAIGIDTAIEHLVRFGFQPEQLPSNLSLALGSTQVTPLELAASYAVLANGGKSVTPFLIEAILDAEGNTMPIPEFVCAPCSVNEDTGPAPEPVSADHTTVGNVAGTALEDMAAGPVQAVSPQNIYLMQSMLRQVILSGTGRKALSLSRPDLAGKTGTTNNFRDAWFSGFTPEVNTTVYVGFDQPSHLGRRESGATAALPIWIDFMEDVLDDYPVKEAIIPESIVSRFINRDTAQITGADDPDGYNELYIAGTEPGVLSGESPITTSQGSQDDITQSLF